jgi:type IV secretory pathway TrbF-like protein
MTTTDPVLPPVGYEYGEARRRYVEAYGSTLVMNTYLKVALLCLAVVTVGLIGLTLRIQHTAQQVKPLVIRIDDAGRATAVREVSLTYTPQAPELQYFLVQFVTGHYSRLRATVRQQYAQSLYFLDGRLADATIEANKKAGTIERFLTGSTEDIDVHVKNVTLEDLRQAPYRATVEFEKVYLSPATRAEVKRETFVAHVVFVLKDQVDNARIPINPLGLTITYFREDQAFVNDVGRAQ